MRSTTQILLAGAAVLGLVSAALAHGDDMDMDMDMGHGASPDTKPEDSSYPPTYFALADHQGLILAHIALMTAGWIFVLPVAVMLSIARSRYTGLTQIVFLVVNALGVGLGAIYNSSTPDLYPNNAHHKLGWIVTAVTAVHVLIGFVGRVAGAFNRTSVSGVEASMSHERQGFIPVSTEAMAEHQRLSGYRLSNDSGQGTERNTESLHSNSSSEDRRRKEEVDDFEDEDLEIAMPTAQPSRVRRLAEKAAAKVSNRVWRVLAFGYNFVDRTILIVGFIAYCLGIIAYGRFFEGHQIFTGLAHWIKGGIFFWLGIVTLGRWAGSFADLGWAWNVRPKSIRDKWRPSAEFVESALIFTYGITNIFLEHLGGADGPWSAQDLEHVSITVLFIGGGLMGMLVESTLIRDLLNTTVTLSSPTPPHDHPYPHEDDEERAAMLPPRQYEFSINPIPALVILLLGIMMSSHTQQEMTSAMVHKQWGNLISGSSAARTMSYVLMWLKPPKSVLPSRPPTELLAAFGLIAGGIVFMISSGDTVDGMIHYGIDAMVMYTITLGLVGLLMAWITIVIAIKGWAVRREAAAKPKMSFGLTGR